MQTCISKFIDKKFAYNHLIIKNPLDGDIDLDFHTHNLSEIIFLKSGNVSGIIGEKTYKIHSDSLIIFRANVPHRIKINDNTAYERYAILFDESKLANQIFSKIPKDLDLISYSGNKYITDIFKKIDYYCENFDEGDLRYLVTHLIEELLFNIYLAPSNDLNRNLVAVHPVIGRAIEFIDTHYTEPITINDISRHLCVTKSHLHHLFMSHLQTTPKKYVNIKRLAKAQQLIRMGEKPSLAYIDCGYSDYATFFRNYITHFGYPPSKENEIEPARRIQSI